MQLFSGTLLFQFTLIELIFKLAIMSWHSLIV